MPDPWTYVGIVGAEAAKFDARMEGLARELIREILRPASHVLVSGGCPLGGVDVWAEEEYLAVCACDEVVGNHVARPDAVIHRPVVNEWVKGFKPRNEAIARDSAIVHNIVVAHYIPAYKGRKWVRADGNPFCYHCARREREQGLMPGALPVHVKSGGCWTAYEAIRLEKHALWHVIG